VEPAAGFVSQVKEELVGFAVVAVERDGVYGNVEPVFALRNDRLRRLHAYTRDTDLWCELADYLVPHDTLKLFSNCRIGPNPPRNPILPSTPAGGLVSPRRIFR